MSRNQKTNILLWTAQLLLAALFLFAGATKFIMPPEMLRGPVPIPLGFMYFIGAAEVLGAVGLVLPGLFRIGRSLTPLAALGLVPIMTGATVVTLEGGMGAGAMIPFVIGAVAATVAYGRRDWNLDHIIKGL